MWAIIAILAAILWGLDYALAGQVLRHISPATLIFLQLCTGTTVTFLVSFISGSGREDVSTLIGNLSLLRLVAFTVLTFNAANFLIFLAIKGKAASAASLIEISYPLFVVLFSWWFFQEKGLTLFGVLGGILIFLGVTVVSLFG